jgi:hypothetical protein
MSPPRGGDRRVSRNSVAVTRATRDVVRELEENEASIVLMCGGLVDGDARLVEFVDTLVELCSSEAVQAWAATPGAQMDDSVWSRLSTSLQELTRSP